MFKKVDTKKRAVITAVLTSVVFFVFSSPLHLRIKDFIFAPDPVQNVKVTQKNNEILLGWDKNSAKDLKSYKVIAESREDAFVDEKTLNYLITGLENGKSYKVSIVAIDSMNRESKKVTFLATPTANINSFTENQKESNSVLFRILPLTVGVSLMLFLFVAWTLFFKFYKESIVPIVAFPSVSLIPYLILSQSFIIALNLELNKFIFSVASSVGMVLFTYLLILTANILNTSRYFDIPLEQAAKASQFIFSLISVYLLLIFTFGSNYNVLERLGLLLPFIAYFTYSAVVLLRGVNYFQVAIRSAGITLVMTLGLIALSIWPLEPVYGMLSGAVFYYIVLSIALEVRNNLSVYVWVEFFVLSGLVSVLLLTNAFWGINGTII